MCDHCGCRSFGPIAELTADHEAILRLAWTVAESARSGAVPDSACVAELAALLDVHVTKEESGLYPVLVRGGDLSEERGDALEDEHRVLRAALAGGAFGRRDFYALAAHIEEEEMELFPAAMFGFDDDAWAEVAAAHRAAAPAPSRRSPPSPVRPP